MMDSPSQEIKSSSWKQSSYSSDTDGKMLESAFSAISISGNRPPALSVSSISSIGEDLNYRGADFSNFYATSGAPSSPLSSASVRSHFHNSSGSALNSPSATSIRYEGSTTPNYQSETSKGSGSHISKYSSLDTALYAGNGHSSLPTFQEHIEDFDQSSFPSDAWPGVRHDDRSQSFQDFDSFSKPRRLTPDSLESSNGPVFGNWPPSNTRSAHSLNNMGSLDENEQYLGNRARSASATATLGYNRGSSFSHTPTYHEELTFDQSRLGGYSHTSDNGIIPQLPARNREESFHNPRQRVMSADAVHNKASGRSLFESSQSMMTPHTFSPLSSNPYTEQHHNRPRSFSSGTTTCPPTPSYRNAPHTTNYFIDSSGSTNHSQPSMQGRMADGSALFHSAQLNDLQHNNLHSSQSSGRAYMNDLQHNNHHASQSSGRSYMHEHQYRSHEGEYGNQDRFTRLRQVQSEKYMPYSQNLDLRQSTPRTVYTVKFKRSQKNFFLSDNIRSDIKIGSYVKVEADRGEDLGIVLSRIPVEKFNPGARLNQARLNTPNMDVPDLQLKRITSLASESDIALLALKEEEETELLKICRNKTLQRGLPMNVLDAEYQFDRHKLTFFFEASCRVDFRELVRDLFGIYKTRIWMQQIDKVPGSPLPINTGTENNRGYGVSNEASSSNNYNILLGRGVDSPMNNYA